MFGKADCGLGWMDAVTSIGRIADCTLGTLGTCNLGSERGGAFDCPGRRRSLSCRATPGLVAGAP
eukprot:1311328-Alexandrium_andersonii.AAC.1